MEEVTAKMEQIREYELIITVMTWFMLVVFVIILGFILINMAYRRGLEDANRKLNAKKSVDHKCCHVGCEDSAKFSIWSSGRYDDDYADFCAKHLPEYIVPDRVSFVCTVDLDRP